MWLSLGCIFGILAIKNDFIATFFGNEYLNAIPILNVLSFYLFSLTLSIILRDVCYLPDHEDKKYIKTVVLGIPINIFLNFILIPKFNAVGAALATIISDYFILIIRFAIVINKIDLKYILFRLIIFIFSSLIMYLVLNILNINFSYHIINMLVKVFIGIIVYFLLTWPCLKSFIFKQEK